MQELNYHHLHLFWVVAREGSIVAASRRLRLSHPTISAQLKQLEEALGAPLFARQGRGRALTDSGRVALRYADEIFALGGELVGSVRHGAPVGLLRLRVGVVDLVPKSVVHRLLEPAFRLGRDLHLVVREDRSLDGFLAEMATHELDLVLSDRPAPHGLPLRLYNHLLGGSDTLVVATPEVARALRPGFPGSLDGARAILPSHGSALRRPLDAWFEQHGVRPLVVAEVDDASLVKVLAEAGVGLCTVPVAIEAEVLRRYRLERIGLVEVHQRFYAISAERRVVHPGVLAIRQAGEQVFS